MKYCLLFFLVIVSSSSFAQDFLPAIQIDTGEQVAEYSLNIQALIFMTTMTFIPALLLTTSSFTRIIIVLAILRQAIGTTQTPSNQILLGLALFLSLFIMAPIYETAYQEGIKPYLEKQLPANQAVETTMQPIRQFMLAQTRENDLALFSDLANNPAYDNQNSIPWHILLPSFLTSELKTAFQIGFLLFIPFLIIDLVVASVLMSMGMMMLSPLIISLPFKIMLFVLVDGWALILGSLADSFLS